MEELAGEIAVITGGAGGIGLALARRFLARGGEVALVDLSAERAQQAAAELGVNARAYGCDVTDRASVLSLAEQVRRDMGGASWVFVNAGVSIGGKLTEADPREFDWLFDVNVRGAFNTIQAFAPMLQERAAQGRTSRFILAGSENSVGLPSTGIMTAYTATKHAVLAMADGLRRDLADTGVKVSIYCPGVVNTRIWDSRAHRLEQYGGATESFPADVVPKIVEMVARIGQDPDETARMVFDGIANGEFMIITSPIIREFAETRAAEVAAALDTMDRRLADTGA